jgi:peptidyl-prolyl cis-trans isomerase D
MLQAIRSKGASIVVQGLFVVLILSFGLWGIGDIFRSRGADTAVATVGDQGIRAEELQTAVRRALEQLSARFGNPIDLQQAKKFGLIDETLNQLIDRSLIDQEVARLRLDVSDDLIRNVIFENPSFRGADGRFDRGLFNSLLAANQLTEDQYVALLRRDIPRNDLIHALTAGATTPRVMADLIYKFRDEKRIAEIVSFPIANAADPGQPSEPDLVAFYEAHQDLFRAPEYRGFTLASLAPSDIAQGIEISAAKLKDEYEQRQDELQIPERREVEQILAPTEDKAKEAEAALADGKDWKEVATTIAGQNPATIDLGLMRREEMPTPLADIAFDLPLNKWSEPVKTALGWHILRIVKIEPPVTQSFEQAKAKLEAELTREEAVDRVYKIANQVDDALAGGAALGEVANKFGLKTTEIAAADVGGKDPDGKAVALPVAPEEVLKLAFATSEGRLSRVTETPDGAIFVLHVDKVTPAAVKPLAEVKDQAIAAWQADRRRETVAAAAAELAGAVKPGTQLAAVAAEKGLKAVASPPFSRRPERDAAVSPVLLAKLFEAQPGETVTAADASGSYVAQLLEVQTPQTIPETAAAGLSRELTTGLQADLREELTQALRARFPVEIRRETLERLF